MKSKLTKVTFRVDDRMKGALQAEAEKRGVTVSEAVRDLVALALDEEKLAALISDQLVPVVAEEVAQRTLSPVSKVSDSIERAARDISLARKQSLNAAEASLGCLLALAFMLKGFADDGIGGRSLEGYGDLRVRDIYSVFVKAGGALSRDPRRGVFAAFRDLEEWGYDPVALLGHSTEEMKRELSSDSLDSVARRDEQIRRSRLAGER